MSGHLLMCMPGKPPLPRMNVKLMEVTSNFFSRKIGFAQQRSNGRLANLQSCTFKKAWNNLCNDGSGSSFFPINPWKSNSQQGQHPDVSSVFCQSLPQQQAVGEVPQESAVCGGTQLMPTDTDAEGGFETLVKKGLILGKVITLKP